MAKATASAMVLDIVLVMAYGLYYGLNYDLGCGHSYGSCYEFS